MFSWLRRKEEFREESDPEETQVKEPDGWIRFEDGRIPWPCWRRISSNDQIAWEITPAHHGAYVLTDWKDECFGRFASLEAAKRCVDLPQLSIGDYITGRPYVPGDVATHVATDPGK